MEKKNSIQMIVALLVLVVVCLIALLIWYPFKKEPVYRVVYMQTGDIYFGKLSTFPSWKLSDAWYLERTQDGALTVQQFSKVIWGPEGEIQLQPKAVLWTAPLDNDSPVIAIMKGEGSPLPAQGATPVPTQE